MAIEYDDINFLLKQKIDEIAVSIYKEAKKRDIISLGLYSGSFGQLLFLLYYSKYFEDKRSVLAVEKYTKKLFIQFVEKETNVSFSFGLTGELYLLDFLREQNIVEMDIGNVQHYFDNCLLIQMRKNIQEKYYDFMHGALGFGLYFLKRIITKEWVLELIEFLYNIAEKNIDYTIFKWESNLIYGKDIYGYNLSMSHGMSSIIIFLSRVIKSGIFNEKIQIMLTGAVNYMLSQEKDFCEDGFFFPSYVLKNSSAKVPKSRLGWCYGDLGVGIAFWQAGEATYNIKWKEKGLEILLKSIQRKDLEQNFVIDAAICHGSAGIAMIYRRMYIVTQNDEFKKASLYWLNQTLDFSRFDDGLAGYKMLINGELMCDFSLLTGISGIGLVFLSFLNDDEQSWDELFLLS